MKNMKTIILLEKGDLPIQIKKQLIRFNFMPLEVKDPSKVRMLDGCSILTGTDITMAALESMQGEYDQSVREKFARNFYLRLKRNEEESLKQSEQEPLDK